MRCVCASPQSRRQSSGFTPASLYPTEVWSPSSQPVLDLQPADTTEVLHVVRDERNVECSSVCGDQRVELSDGRATARERAGDARELFCALVLGRYRRPFPLDATV